MSKIVLVGALALLACGCSVLVGPKVECHMVTERGRPASVTPPDSLHLPTVTIQVTSTRRVCTRV